MNLKRSSPFLCPFHPRQVSCLENRWARDSKSMLACHGVRAMTMSFVARAVSLCCWKGHDNDHDHVSSTCTSSVHNHY